MERQWESLKRPDIWQRVRRSGRMARGQFLRLFLANSAQERPRVGIAVTKRVDKKAVVRNKLRRRLRAIIDKQIQNGEQPFDLVVAVNPTAVDASYADLKRDFEQAWQGLTGRTKR